MAGLLVQLNADWRVSDDPPQWALQFRDGHAREKASGWAGRKFIRDRDHMPRRIVESCGEVDPAAVETIRSWPVGYVTWKLQEMHPRAGPDTDPHSAMSSSDASGSPLGDEAPHAGVGAA